MVLDGSTVLCYAHRASAARPARRGRARSPGVWKTLIGKWLEREWTFPYNDICAAHSPITSVIDPEDPNLRCGCKRCLKTKGLKRDAEGNVVVDPEGKDVTWGMLEEWLRRGIHSPQSSSSSG